MPLFSLTGANVTNPASTDTLGGSLTPHDQQHTLANNEIAALDAFHSQPTGAVNFPILQAGATGADANVSAGGGLADANINLALYPKGTGVVKASKGFRVNGVAATDIIEVLNGVSGQTGDLVQWQVNGAVKSRIDSNGNFAYGVTGTVNAPIYIQQGSPNITLYDGTCQLNVGIISGLYTIWNSVNNMGFQLRTNNTQRLVVTNLGSVIIGAGSALATTATDGFLYMPSGAGAPTGVPTAQTGTVPFYYDTTTHKIWIYDAGWKGVAIA